MSAAVQIIEPETDIRAAMRAIGARPASGARARQRRGGGEEPRALAAAARPARRAGEILAANAQDLAGRAAKVLRRPSSTG